MAYGKRGQALARDMKRLGSCRYAVIEPGGPSEEALDRGYAQIRRMPHLSGETAH